MGVHPKAPSTVSYPLELKGQLLSKWLANNQWALGERVCEEFHGKLPFLFKVRMDVQVWANNVGSLIANTIILS